jgi:MFS family permease
VEAVERTLRYFATQLTEHGTADLVWWHIPTWTPHRFRMTAGAATIMLVNTLVYGLALGFAFGPALGLVLGLVYGLMVVVAFSAVPWREAPVKPQRIAPPTYRGPVQSLLFGLAIGLSGGLMAGLSAGLLSGLSAGLVAGFCVGLVSGLAGVVLRAIARYTDFEETSLGPADLWRDDRNAGLVYTLVAGLAIGLVAVLTVRLVPGLASALASRLSVVVAIGLPVGLVVGLAATAIAKRMGTAASSPGTAVADTALAAVHLAIRHKVPLRLIAFLEDARSRHLLRTIGPVYQFRHAALQARLAQQSPGVTGNGSGTSPKRG